jgi:hypothetical protein
MADIFDELVGNGAPPEELIAQLRKQRTLGQLGALSSDKRIAGLGGNVAQDSMNTAVDLRNRKDKSQAREDQQAFSRWQQEQAMQGRKDQLGLQRESLAQARALAEQQMANARSIAGLRNAANKSANLTPFEKSRQQKIGTESADWDTSGKIQTQAALSDIDKAITGLATDPKIGNSKTSWLPGDEKIRAYTDPDGLKIQRLANRVTVENLRNTFGSQFTESEGRAFKALDYDPALSNADNLANLRQKKLMIEAHIKRKNELFGKYRGADELPNFEGQTMNTLSDEDIVNSIMQGQL